MFRGYNFEQLRDYMNAYTSHEPSTSTERENSSSVRIFERNDSKAWANLVNYILPQVANNLNIQQKILQNIKDEYTTFDVNTLFWKTMEKLLVDAAGIKMQEFSDYMRFKSPAMFVNSPLNLLPKFMTVLMKVCNWQAVADDYFYVHLKRNHSYIKCSRGELFVGTPVGIQNALDMERQVTPFVEMLVLARVNALFARHEGYKDLQLSEEIWERMTEINDDGRPTEFFKRCALNPLKRGRQQQHYTEAGFYSPEDVDAPPGLAKLLYLRPIHNDKPFEELSSFEQMLHFDRVMSFSDGQRRTTTSELVARNRMNIRMPFHAIINRANSQGQ